MLAGLALAGLSVPAASGFPVINDAGPQFADGIYQDGRPVVIEILRDSVDPLRFYYVPATPRIAMAPRIVDGEKRMLPAFHLFQFQRRISGGTGFAAEGGLLQCAITLGLSEEERSQLVPNVKRAMDLEASRAIELVPVPIRDIHADLYTPATPQSAGRWISSGTRESLLSPLDANGATPLAIPLAVQEVGIYKALLASATGLPATYTLWYEAEVPPAGFTVRFAWEALRQYFQTDPKKSLRKGLAVQGNGLPADAVCSMMAEIAEAGGIEILRHGATVTNLPAQADLVRAAPALEAIYRELFAGAPADMGNAAASPSPSGSQDIPVALDLKGARELQKSLPEMDLTKPVRVLRRATASGFVGLGIHGIAGDEAGSPTGIPGAAAFDQNPVLRHLVTWVADDHWRQASFVLPNLAVAKALEVSEVLMEVALVAGGQDREVRTARWLPDAGGSPMGEWVAEGKAARALCFDLMELPRRFGPEYAQHSRFRVATTLRSAKSGPLRESCFVPLFTGELPMAVPHLGVRIVEVDGSHLPFGPGEINSVRLELIPHPMTGQRTLSDTLTDERRVAHFPIQARERLEYVLLAHFKRFVSGRPQSVAWAGNGITRTNNYLHLTY